ncbi:MAG TPA: 2-isopropylmalate synthase [Polyangia bacterium]|nr:2-isopropylmalate synthase [Polyangia bacterium]
MESNGEGAYVKIFDTTLRDGEQSPGATLTAAEKLEVARALSRLGADVIEAGFPAASPDDLRAVEAIASEVGTEPVDGRRAGEPPIICALARASADDLELAWQGVRRAAHPRIHTFLATSELHMKHKLRMTPAQVVERVRQTVRRARSLCSDVEFSCEDAGRSDPEFLYEVIDEAIRAGATTLNIPDTVGYTTPDEFGELIAGIRARVAGIDRVTLSVHCHDDLGLATANTLAGLRAGARQAEVAMNGIGERAGNCALEEVVMALHTRYWKLRLRTGIDTTQLTRVSRLVSTCTGMVVQPNKAVVGANAFSHEAGIHQDGMLKHEETYEIMQPETVGAGPTRLVLGKHSGRHAFKLRMAELGHALDEDEVDRAFERFKRLADRKKHVSEADLETLVATDLKQTCEYWVLEDLQVGCGTMGLPTASVRLRGPDGASRVRAQVGTGPVDAAYKAIDELVGRPSTLLEYVVRAVTEGIDALAEVSVRVRGEDAQRGLHPQGNPRAGIFHGHGADTDVIVASVKAYLAALNRMLTALDARRPEARLAVEEARS